jgi:hypothetical protein
MFGGQTDPVPFIAAAYAVGGLLLLGYAAWQLMLRKKLRRLEQAIEEGAKK